MQTKFSDGSGFTSGRTWELYKHTPSTAQRNQIAEENEGLVRSCCCKYRNSPNDLYDEVIQEAWIGLLTAVERYNPELGYSFSTYATFWIRQAIRRYFVNKEALVRLPENVDLAVHSLERSEIRFCTEYGREPTSVKELADYSELEVEQVQSLRAAKGMRTILSLNASYSRDDSHSLGKVPLSDDPANHVMRVVGLLPDSVRLEDFSRALGSLKVRELEVLLLRAMEYHLEEIGKHYHLSRQRIKVIESAGLKKVRKYLGFAEDLGPDGVVVRDQKMFLNEEPNPRRSMKAIAA